MNRLNNLVLWINRLRLDPQAENLEDLATAILAGFLSLMVVIAIQ
jgi:hypothetical protein